MPSLKPHASWLFSRLLIFFFFFLTPLWGSVSGGTLRIGWVGYPPSPLYYLGYDDLSLTVSSLVLEKLVELSPSELKIQGRLAKKWVADKDYRSFHFWIEDAAAFSDGHPVTSEDVAFTLKTIQNPANATLGFQDKFEIFTECKIINPKEFILKTKAVTPLAVELLDEFFVLPKHAFEGKNFNTAFNTGFLGSGPYIFSKALVGNRIELKKNTSYWGKNLKSLKGKFNFDEIHFVSGKDIGLLYESLKHQEIDFLSVYSAKAWNTISNSDEVKNQKVAVLKYETKLPQTTFGILWNQRRPVFQSKNLRRALSHLLDRPRIIKDFCFNSYIEATGVVHSLSPYHSPDNVPIPFAPAFADDLLQKDGWKRNSLGLLEKSGAPLSFTVLSANEASAKYLSLYQEELKRHGIDMKFVIKDRTQLLKLRNEFDFDGVEISVMRGLWNDELTESWDSRFADKMGSRNFAGLKNAEVDSLLKTISSLPAGKRRTQTLQKLDRFLANEQPLTFLWEPTYFNIAYSPGFQFPEIQEPYVSHRDVFYQWWKTSTEVAHHP